MIRNSLLSLSLLLLSLVGSSQQNVLEILHEEFDEFHFTYLSESMLRAAINLADSAGTMTELSENLELLVFFKIEVDQFENSENKIAQLKSVIESDTEIELLISQRSGDSEGFLWTVEKEGEIRQLVGLGTMNGFVAYGELHGVINLQILMDEGSSGLKKLTELTGMNEFINPE